MSTVVYDKDTGKGITIQHDVDVRDAISLGRYVLNKPLTEEEKATLSLSSEKAPEEKEPEVDLSDTTLPAAEKEKKEELKTPRSKEVEEVLADARPKKTVKK